MEYSFFFKSIQSLQDYINIASIPAVTFSQKTNLWLKSAYQQNHRLFCLKMNPGVKTTKELLTKTLPWYLEHFCTVTITKQAYILTCGGCKTWYSNVMWDPTHTCHPCRQVFSVIVQVACIRFRIAVKVISHTGWKSETTPLTRVRVSGSRLQDTTIGKCISEEFKCISATWEMGWSLLMNHHRGKYNLTKKTMSMKWKFKSKIHCKLWLNM